MILLSTIGNPGFTLYLFIICVVLAILEVQIEGPHGWAANLPTWRADAKWLLRLTSGKPITGYHICLNALLLLLFHLPMWLYGWTLEMETATIGIYMMMAVEWDFLWFVLNPHFGIARFNPDHVWWFRKWVLGVPADYYLALIVSLALWTAHGYLAGTPTIKSVTQWFFSLGMLGVLTVGTMAAVRVFRTYQQHRGQ